VKHFSSTILFEDRKVQSTGAWHTRPAHHGSYLSAKVTDTRALTVI
jgi:hypothetical protein